MLCPHSLTTAKPANTVLFTLHESRSHVRRKALRNQDQIISTSAIHFSSLQPDGWRIRCQSHKRRKSLVYELLTARKGPWTAGEETTEQRKRILPQLHLSLNRRGVSWVWISVRGVCNSESGNDWTKERILTQLHLSLNRRGVSWVWISVLGVRNSGRGNDWTKERFLHSFICHSIDVECPGFESRSSGFVTARKETIDQRNAFLHSFICHSIDVCVLLLNLGSRGL